MGKPLARVIRKGEQNKISNIKKGHRSTYSTASQRELIIKNSFVLTYLATPWQRNDQTSFKKNSYIHTKKNPVLSVKMFTQIYLQVQMSSLANPTKQLKKKDYEVFYKFSLRKQNEEIVPNSFYENSITLIPKSEKDKQ